MSLPVDTPNRREISLRRFLLVSAVTLIFPLLACDGSSEGEAPASLAQSAESQVGAGDLALQGNLVFPNTKSLFFYSSGVVGDVLVKRGDAVSNGQLLASLDAQTISSLETTVAQAKSGVTDARNGLDALIVDPNVQVAAAELDVASAKVRHDDARAAVDTLSQHPSRAVADTQAKVAQAEIALNGAREELNDLLEPSEVAVAEGEDKVAKAKVELDAAQEAYDVIKVGSFPEEEVIAARNRAAFATTALGTATRGRTDAQAAAQAELTQAEDAEYLAKEQYTALFRFWFGTELTDVELGLTADEVLEEWGIDLDATFRRFNPEYATVEPVPNDPTTRWNELVIWAWINLSLEFSTIVPTCTDEDVVDGAQRCITRELQNAYDALAAARESLEAARNRAASVADETTDAIASAEAALSDARNNLEDIEDGPDTSSIESAQKRLQLAQASLQEAQDELSELTADIDPLEMAKAHAEITEKEVGLREAKDEMRRAEDDVLRVVEADRRLELALAELRAAENKLDAVLEVVSDDVAEAEAKLAQAQVTLVEAQAALAGAVITSPMDGIVSLVNIRVDDAVKDDLTAITVVSTDIVEMKSFIDATDRPYVSEGASAVVDIASLGGTSLDGRVTYIGSDASTERGVISYEVRIRAEVPPGVEVPLSLSAASAFIRKTGI